ncbi:MAG: ATP-dependent DNA ligase, partial [Nocardioides sp.]
IRPEWGFADVRHAAIGFGRELERRDEQVTTAWWKEERGERIFVDFNQNTRDRTIASAYSLRPIPGAPVSTPLHWDELAGVSDPSVFNLFTVPGRLVDGDPWATIDDEAYSLEPLLALWEELPGGELNYPPDHPKMPGEPPRVQPSKKVAAHWDESGNRVEP